MAFILIDDTHDQLVNGLKEFGSPVVFSGIGLPTPAVSPAGKGAIYWDNIGHQFLHSDNGGPWTPFGSVTALVRGTVTFPNASSVSVLFSIAQPDTTYFVALGWDSDEVINWVNKTISGFGLVSSNGNSIAIVDWILVR